MQFKLFSKEVRENIGDFYIKVRYFLPDLYSILRERIGRSLAYAKFGYLNYDFDGQYVYSLISFKLKRVKKCLENGHAIHEECYMKALDEAIKICDRLYSDTHEDVQMELLSQKWGEPEFVFTPKFESKRKNRVTKEDENLYMLDLVAAYDKGEENRKKDVERLAEIFKTSLPGWWD